MQTTVAKKVVKETDEPGGAKVKDVLETVDGVRDEVGTTGVEVRDKIVKCPKSKVESPVKVTAEKQETLKDVQADVEWMPSPTKRRVFREVSVGKKVKGNVSPKRMSFETRCKCISLRNGVILDC